MKAVLDLINVLSAHTVVWAVVSVRNCFSILLDTTYLAVLFFFYFVTCPCSSRTKRHDNLFVDDDDDDRSRAASWASLSMGCLFSFCTDTDRYTDRQTDTQADTPTDGQQMFKKEINDWSIKQRFLRTSVARKQTDLLMVERSPKWDVIISFISVHSSSARYTDVFTGRDSARRPSDYSVESRTALSLALSLTSALRRAHNDVGWRRCLI